MKRHRGRSHSLLIALLLVSGLGGARVGWGDAADPMDGLQHMPQAQGDLPPTPLSSAQEELVLNAVFARFPNVDQTLMLEYIRTHFPGELQEFTLMSMQNLRGAIDFLIRLVGECLELQALEQDDPEVHALRMRHLALERRARELAGKIVRQNGPEREVLVNDLRTALADAFAVKQELMRRDISGIRRQVEELETLVTTRDANRQTIIDRRLADMTGPGDAARW